MPKIYERVCKCGKVELTASKSPICQSCYKAGKSGNTVLNEIAFMEGLGYTVVGEPYMNNNRKRVYKLITPCKHDWEVVYGNFTKQVQNAREKQLNLPCGKCGASSRTLNATLSQVK